MGFSVEYLCRLSVKNKITASIIIGLLGIAIGLMTYSINQISINRIKLADGFDLSVGRNAIDHPPNLSGKLNNDSVIIIERFQAK